MASTSISRSPRTDWFINDRLGMFIHWGLYAMPARHEWVRQREQISIADYQKYFDRFDPDLYAPSQWAKRAKAAGMKYAVLTTKHHDGFCLWDTQQTDYKATNTPAGRDLVASYVDAFRAEGLKVGFYYSLLDWHHPDFTVDRLHPMANNAEERAKNVDRDMSRYAAYMREQVRELLTGYGKIDILWFDFSYPGEDGKGAADWESEKLVALVRDLMPNVIMDNRLDLPGVGDFITPEQFQPDSGYFDEHGVLLPWEACQTFSGSWGYHRDESSWKSMHQLLWMLIDGVSKGGNLLLNVGPTARGEFDDRACDRLDGIGRWMHCHSRSIYGCTMAPKDWIAPPDCRYTWNPTTGRLYLHLMSWPFKHITLPGLGDRIAYAQFLHDGSEVRFTEIVETAWNGLSEKPAMGLSLPTVKPAVEIPVIELFLKD